MKSAAAVVAGLLAISTTASAGGYLGLALGTQPAVNDELDAIAKPFGRSLRGLGGIRFGNLSIEGAVNGFSVGTQRGDKDVYQASVALKLNIPIGNNFEAFARGGLERTWFSLDDNNYDFRGDGYLVGGGFEYRLNAVLANASIFIDYTVHKTTLENPNGLVQIDATSRMWGLGLTVGI